MTGEGSAPAAAEDPRRALPVDPAERQIAAVVTLAREVLGDDVIALYLYGSATLGGLQNHSDIDLFVVSARSLTGAEKRRVVDGLLEISGDPARAAASWQDTRPLEVTIAARPGIDPWRFPPAMERQYGEWLRTEFAAGSVFPDEPTPNADLALLLESVRRTGRALAGPREAHQHARDLLRRADPGSLSLLRVRVFGVLADDRHPDLFRALSAER